MFIFRQGPDFYERGFDETKGRVYETIAENMNNELLIFDLCRFQQSVRNVDVIFVRGVATLGSSRHVPTHNSH